MGSMCLGLISALFASMTILLPIILFISSVGGFRASFIGQLLGIKAIYFLIATKIRAYLLIIRSLFQNRNPPRAHP